jgi:plastocyanin
VRRTLSLIFSVVALAGLVSACGSDDDTTESGLASASDTTATDNDGGDHGDMDDNEMDHGANTPVAPDARPIEVSGSSYAFDPGELTVRAGEDVAMVLTATDIEHDFTVDELDAHVSAEAGETAEGGLRADKAGTYTYYCSVEGHREAGMEGTLTVEST